MSRSQRSVVSETNPPSQRSYNDRPRRDRPSPNGQPNGERRDRRSHDRLSSQAPVRGQHSRPPTVISDHHSRHNKGSFIQQSPPSSRHHKEKQTFSEKCSNLCSRRGLLQLVEIFINLLVLICAAATQSASAGFSSLGAFGSTYYYSMGYSMSGFQGDEVTQVTQLDVQYSQMKLPTIYAAVAISLLLLSLTLSCLAARCMARTAQNGKLLLMEEVFNVLSAITCIICIALYIHFIKHINGTEVCKQRQALYNRRGYTSVTCDIMGTEMAVCIFAVILAVLYISSAVIVGLMLKEMKMDANTPNLESIKNLEQQESELENLKRVLQFVEITSGVLVLICVVASYAVLSGYTSAAGFGSFSINSAYSPFEGTELQQVRDVDLQYSQLRAPGVYAGVAFSLLFCALTIVFLVLGSKPIHRVSIKLLIVEMIFDVLGCLGYIVAVGLYLYFIKKVNATDTCKTRERLYAGRGYTWMNCEVQGGDAAVAIFGLVAACVYLPSAILCVLYIRTVREFRKNYLSDEYAPTSHNDNQQRLHRSREDSLNFLPSTLV